MNEGRPGGRSPASDAYLVDYCRQKSGKLSYVGLYRRDATNFPDFEDDGAVFQPVYGIDNIEGITFDTAADKDAIQKAFHARGEGERVDSFLISELAQYFPSRKRQ